MDEVTETRETKWTEGPWQQRALMVVAPDGSQICHTGGTRYRGATPQPYESEANAALIAAAPDADKFAERTIARITGLLAYDLPNTVRAEMEAINADAEQWRAKARGEQP